MSASRGTRLAGSKWREGSGPLMRGAAGRREDCLVARTEGGQGVSEVWVEDVGWRLEVEAVAVKAVAVVVVVVRGRERASVNGCDLASGYRQWSSHHQSSRTNGPTWDGDV